MYNDLCESSAQHWYLKWRSRIMAMMVQCTGSRPWSRALWDTIMQYPYSDTQSPVLKVGVEPLWSKWSDAFQQDTVNGVKHCWQVLHDEHHSECLNKCFCGVTLDLSSADPVEWPLGYADCIHCVGCFFLPSWSSLHFCIPDCTRALSPGEILKTGTILSSLLSFHVGVTKLFKWVCYASSLSFVLSPVIWLGWYDFLPSQIPNCCCVQSTLPCWQGHLQLPPHIPCGIEFP